MSSFRDLFAKFLGFLKLTFKKCTFFNLFNLKSYY
jgi:hypothetical protein